ncbi:MAG: hypothetical protein NVSMB1_10110 [Polyangiales bacterium]
MDVPTDIEKKPRKIRFVKPILGVALVLFLARFAFREATKITPPKEAQRAMETLVASSGIAHVGPSWVRRRGAIWELSLSGDPFARGASLARLMRSAMVEDEQEMYAAFARAVPFAPARWAIVNLGRFRYRHVDREIPAQYRDELAGLAFGFAPDPFESVLPSYHRFVFLYSVYDIALSFEKSPLIGCSTFTVPFTAAPTASNTTDEAAEKQKVATHVAEQTGNYALSTRGHAFLARAFDFEAGESFDRDKVVFLVREPGRIPFASIGWPGFIGVVSGMNREGVAMVVHGGRAGTPQAVGIPVVFSLREALATAHDTDEAVRVLSAQNVMVSHIVIVQDASGNTAVVERAPHTQAFVRRSHARLATTNHFEGPLASDPRDAEVRRNTSTLARRARADQLLHDLKEAPSVVDMVAALRDRLDLDSKPLPLGDRRAIDALIATHGVVFDTTDRAMWVSESPHLLGRFVRFPLSTLLADDFDPSADRSAEGGEGFAAIPADPLLVSGQYDLNRLTQP